MNESKGWSGRHDAARDEAWRALHRLGVSQWDLGIAKRTDPPPAALMTLARELGRAVVEPAEMVLDELGADLDLAARKRIMEGAARSALYGVASGLVSAIADELSRTEPVPFAPPPAGSWIRARCLPRESSTSRWRGQDAPSWDGAWHLFSGDWSEGDRRTHGIRGRMRCGWTVTLRDENFSTGKPMRDYVTIDELPSVDACRRCYPRPRLHLVNGGAS
jgi:hypothetical protein